MRNIPIGGRRKSTGRFYLHLIFFENAENASCKASPSGIRSTVQTKWLIGFLCVSFFHPKIVDTIASAAIAQAVFRRVSSFISWPNRIELLYISTATFACYPLSTFEAMQLMEISFMMVRNRWEPTKASEAMTKCFQEARLSETAANRFFYE